jgi:hypothetical protein
MTPRRTNQPLDLEAREDLEREVYSSTRDQGTLAEMRDDAAAAYAQAVTALKRPSVVHNDNQDETKYQEKAFMGSFNKGLPRLAGGTDGTECLPQPDEFLRFRRAIHTANFFEGPDVPHLGPKATGWRVAEDDVGLRGWEAPEAGLSFEPHGPDPHSVTMAAAPQLESTQLAFEMAEVYWLALLRDIPLTEFSECPTGVTQDNCEREVSVAEAVADLNAMAYAANGFRDPDSEADGIPSRKRLVGEDGQLTAATVFRGITAGDAHGPYVSQFLLIGCPNPADGATAADINLIKKGNIGFGAQVISQKLRPHLACVDHMTDRASYLDVQEAAKVNAGALFEDEPRFLQTPRDLATYVHYDALYQAYLNACLMLIGFGAPVDPGIAAHNNLDAPLTADLKNPTDGFALFGGPHVLNLVTEVATRSLKAVRYQKFNVHCRLRPEAVGGIIEFDPYNLGSALQARLSSNLKNRIKAWNRAQNSSAKFDLRTQLNKTKIETAGSIDAETLLLPMAFPEGSPMHPAYGAGHATVAGACVTMLKAFFDTDAVFVKDTDRKPNEVRIIRRTDYEADKTRFKPISFVPTNDGKELRQVAPGGNGPLTVGGELDKLAANIAIARNMAGVHFYTDYIDSLTMGEEVAIRTLEESISAFQQYPISVRPSMSIPKFLGGFERVGP